MNQYIDIKNSAMITNEQELKQAFEQLQRMRRALVALQADLLSSNLQRFVLLAEGPLDEICKLCREIDVYISNTT